MLIFSFPSFSIYEAVTYCIYVFRYFRISALFKLFYALKVFRPLEPFFICHYYLSIYSFILHRDSFVSNYFLINRYLKNVVCLLYSAHFFPANEEHICCCTLYNNCKYRPKGFFLHILVCKIAKAQLVGSIY